MSFQISRYYGALKTAFRVFLLMVVFLFGVSVLVDYYSRTYVDVLIKEIKKLPDADYISEIKKLRTEGKLDEALELSRFVSEHPDMPGSLEAKRLEAEIDAELNSTPNKVWRFLRGALTGSPKTGADALGAVASDFFVFGDIRDLVVQGGKAITNQETDKLVITLSAIGLLTETVKPLDGVPALLKVFKKVGSITREFAGVILKVSQKALKQMKVTSDLKKLLTLFKDVVKNMGFTKSAHALKFVDSVEDLSVLASVSAKAPRATFVLLKNGGEEAFATIKTINKTDKAKELVVLAARKGKRGVQFLAAKSRKIRFITRMIKDFRLGRIQAIIMSSIMSFPPLIFGVWVLVLGSAWRLLLYLRRFWKVISGRVHSVRC